MGFPSLSPEFLSLAFRAPAWHLSKSTYLTSGRLFRTPTIVSIADENQNGMPELVLITHVWSAGGHEFQIYEWNGSEFDNLLPQKTQRSLTQAQSMSTTTAAGISRHRW